MLVQFSVENFLSFKNRVTLHLNASAFKELEATNLLQWGKWRILHSAVIYGANASGKSNLLAAMSVFKRLLTTDRKEKLPVSPFRLNPLTSQQPSTMELVFIHEEVTYRYGFQVTSTQVMSEWLFMTKKSREVPLFLRQGQQIEVKPLFKKARGLEQRTRENAFFLYVAAQFNVAQAEGVFHWLKKLHVISAVDDRAYLGFTLEQLKNERIKQRIIEFLKFADLGIQNVSSELHELREMLPDQITDEYFNAMKRKNPSLFGWRESKNKLESLHLEFLHVGTGEDENPVYEKFSLEDESEGTKKIFALAAPILDVLEHGAVLVIDELDARLHPLLTKFILTLFHQRATNPHHAQLIFATHDTHLLNAENFRRDQIWFTEKDREGATDLYSLAQYKFDKKQIKKGTEFAKDYILGKYGAIPFIGDSRQIFWEESDDHE